MYVIKDWTFEYITKDTKDSNTYFQLIKNTTQTTRGIAILPTIGNDIKTPDKLN